MHSIQITETPALSTKCWRQNLIRFLVCGLYKSQDDQLSYDYPMSIVSHRYFTSHSTLQNLLEHGLTAIGTAWKSNALENPTSVTITVIQDAIESRHRLLNTNNTEPGIIRQKINEYRCRG
ncbi:hypothetical protein T08_14175 [Trichinella sp. T8]|nr:hypothetical protein T08_14175 [Trichinella sp. T8]